MVLFSGMYAMKWPGLLFFFLLMEYSGVRRIELTGQQFCVPKKYIIPDVPWVKADGRAVRESKGVAIFNCDSIRLPNNTLALDKCLFYQKINSFVVDEDDGGNWRFDFWKPGYEKSTIGMMLSANDTRYTIADDGRLLAMDGQGIHRNSRIVWSRNDGYFSPGDRPTAGKDVILASCHNTTTRIGAPPGLFRPAVSCNREFISGRLSISYTFESTTPVPSLATVRRFDQTILDWLEQIRCK